MLGKHKGRQWLQHIPRCIYMNGACEWWHIESAICSRRLIFSDCLKSFCKFLFWQNDDLTGTTVICELIVPKVLDGMFSFIINELSESARFKFWLDMERTVTRVLFENKLTFDERVFLLLKIFSIDFFMNQFFCLTVNIVNYFSLVYDGIFSNNSLELNYSTIEYPLY